MAETATERILMNNRLGGCQCGEVRYALSAPPLTLYVCHYMSVIVSIVRSSRPAALACRCQCPAASTVSQRSGVERLPVVGLSVVPSARPAEPGSIMRLTAILQSLTSSRVRWTTRSASSPSVMFGRAAPIPGSGQQSAASSSKANQKTSHHYSPHGASKIQHLRSRSRAHEGNSGQCSCLVLQVVRFEPDRLGSSLKGVGKSEFGGGLAIAQGGSRLA